jgi:trans-aconitate 2-methyltransferase
MATNTHWNAEVYDRIGTPMRGWAEAVIDDLELRGDEAVLDAGCGSGSVTFDLLERLPNGKIYALDYSAEMIEQMESKIAETGEKRVIAMQADLTNFELPEQVDVVFSNAVFHWIPDDDALFGALLRATKPGGRMRVQCGGGNIYARLGQAWTAAMSTRPFSEHLGTYKDGKTYRSPQQAKEALERAGWSEVRTWAFDAPVPFESEDDAALYLRTIILRDHVANLPEDLHEPYVRKVIAEYVDRFGKPFTADYVRLNMWARRPA